MSPPTLSRAGLPRQFFHQLSNRSTVLESVEIHMRRVSNSSQHLGPGAPSVRDDPPKELPAGKLLGAAFREVGLCLVPEKNGSFEDSPQAEPGRKSEHDDDLGSKESMMQRAAVVAVHHPIEFGVRRLDPSRIPKVLVQNGRGGGGGRPSPSRACAYRPAAPGDHPSLCGAKVGLGGLLSARGHRSR